MATKSKAKKKNGSSLLIIVGIIIVLLIVTVYFLTSDMRRFNAIGSDVPKYSNSEQWKSEYYGGSFICCNQDAQHITFISADSSPDIAKYYINELSKNDWKIKRKSDDFKTQKDIPFIEFEKEFGDRVYDLYIIRLGEKEYFISIRDTF